MKSKTAKKTPIQVTLINKAGISYGLEVMRVTIEGQDNMLKVKVIKKGYREGQEVTYDKIAQVNTEEYETLSENCYVEEPKKNPF